MVTRTRELAKSLLRPGRFVGLAGAQYAAEMADLDVWSLTEARRVLVPTRSLLLCNILQNLAGAAAQNAGLEEDQGDLRWLATVDDAFASGFLTRCADEHGRTFEVLPEQLALAMAIARGPCTALRVEVKKKNWFSPPSAPCATFSLLSSAPGSGKTAVVVLAALHTLGAGWDTCASSFEQWKKSPPNMDPAAPVHPTAGRLNSGDSSRVARAALIVVTRSTEAQWRGAFEKTLSLVAGPGAPQLVSTDPFKEMKENPDRAIVSVMLPSQLKAYFNTHWGTGCAFLAMDEIATHAAELPTGRNFGDKPFPSVYRMVGMSATFMNLLIDKPWPKNRDQRTFAGLGGGNLLKALFMSRPWERKLEEEELENTWKRVCIAMAAPAVQLSLSVSLAERCIPAVSMRNIRVTAARLLPLLQIITGRITDGFRTADLRILRDEPDVKSSISMILSVLAWRSGVLEQHAAVQLVRQLYPDQDVSIDLDTHHPTIRSCLFAIVKEIAMKWQRGDANRACAFVLALFHVARGRRDGVITQRGGLWDGSESFFLGSESFFLAADTELTEPETTTRCTPVPCSHCGVPGRLVRMHACGCCTAIICATCVTGLEGAGCNLCAPTGVVEDVHAAEAASTLGLVGAVAWALDDAITKHGARRLVVFAHDPTIPTYLAAAGRAAKLNLKVVTGKDGMKTFKKAALSQGETLVLYVADNTMYHEMITGVNLGNANAVIALNRLYDEQQAFSRALRMLPPEADIPAVLPVYRLLHKHERPGVLGVWDPPASGGQASPTAEGEDLTFAGQALSACQLPDEQMMESDTPFGLPKKVAVCIKPAAARSRLMEYELRAEVDSIAGAYQPSAVFELLFKVNLRDPFVPADAAGLRVWNEGGRVRACWVQATKAPSVVHPDVATDRIRIVVEAANGQRFETCAVL